VIGGVFLGFWRSGIFAPFGLRDDVPAVGWLDSNSPALVEILASSGY
jgi:hypothetical protein